MGSSVWLRRTGLMGQGLQRQLSANLTLPLPTPTQDIQLPAPVSPPMRGPLPQRLSNPAAGEPAEPSAPPAGEQRTHTRYIPRPPIVAHAEWTPVEPVQSFIAQVPERITLHHEGVIFDGSVPAPEYLRAVQHWSITGPGWADVPYHFIIDQEGAIYEGRPLNARGDSNTSYDLQNMALVSLLGKYDAGEQVPEQVQINAIIDIMAWIAFRYNIPADADHIKGHRDYIPVDPITGRHIDPVTGEHVTCPGDNLYIYLSNGMIIEGIARRLAGTQ